MQRLVAAARSPRNAPQRLASELELPGATQRRLQVTSKVSKVPGKVGQCIVKQILKIAKTLMFGLRIPDSCPSSRLLETLVCFVHTFSEFVKTILD